MTSSWCDPFNQMLQGCFAGTVTVAFDCFGCGHTAQLLQKYKRENTLHVKHANIVFDHLANSRNTAAIIIQENICNSIHVYGILFHRYSKCLISYKSRLLMMTSSNENIFRVTGPLCGKFTCPRWIPRTKASDAELWCFLWSATEKAVQ